MMKRKLRNLAKRMILKIHKLSIRLGLHILPVHYYSPVPNILELERTKDIWAKKSDLPGIFIDLEDQAKNLKNICLPYQTEYVGNKIYQEGVSKHFGPGYGYIEAQALHSVIRYYKPKKIIEVGSGVSTFCMLKALDLNRKETGIRTLLTCIEPFPSNILSDTDNIDLVIKNVQNISVNLFSELEANDMLFIDSSHTVKPGGDVNYLILEILPRLKSGVIIHFHDIYLPYDYQRTLLRTFLHWSETSLLHAFLIFNSKAKIIFCQSMLHYDCQDALTKTFPEYNPNLGVHGLDDETEKPFEVDYRHFPSSIYIQIQ